MKYLSGEQGVKLLLNLFKGKEKPKIVNCLKNGPLRFSELHKQLEPISKKVLSTQLKSLEKVGLIERKVYSATPIRVEYSITPLLNQAQPLFDIVKTWEDDYRTHHYDRIKTEEIKKADHPFGLIIEIFGDKWTPEIIFALDGHCKRFGELRKELHPISQRVLTSHLRDLEHYGFVSRTVHNEKTLHVEYCLTDLCYSLKPMEDEMINYHMVYNKWKEKNPLE